MYCCQHQPDLTSLSGGICDYKNFYIILKEIINDWHWLQQEKVNYVYIKTIISDKFSRVGEINNKTCICNSLDTQALVPCFSPHYSEKI